MIGFVERFLPLVVYTVGIFSATIKQSHQSTDSNDAATDQPLDQHLKNRGYWRTRNGDELLRELRRQPNTKIAKNIVFLMGDGYSNIDTTVARIFKDQMHGIVPAGHNKLVYEEFDYNGELRTLSCDNWATDSAAAITAYATGAKSNEETLNVGCNVKWRSCAGANESNHLTIITELLKQAGKIVGIVTNTRITHASPAGFYAHSSNREWESDADLLTTHAQVACEKDIARQLVEDAPGRDIDVLLGGGIAKFLPANSSDGGRFVGTGGRLDGRNLVSAWLESHPPERSVFVSNRTSLRNVDVDTTDYLLGMFSHDHLAYQLDRIDGPVAPQSITPEQIQAHSASAEPTLLEMTQKALAVLQAKANRTGQGFFLYVEGGKIDLAHHYNYFAKSLHETLEFERAVRWVREHTSEDDTLIIVSSDHAHSSYFIGHARQTEPILGAGKALYEVERQPFATLGYATGPGGNYSNTGPRPGFAATSDPLVDKDHVSQAGIFMQIGSHGGQDVPVFANGPWAHLVNGQHDNTYLFDVMTFAACLPTVDEAHTDDVMLSNDAQADSSVRHAKTQRLKRDSTRRRYMPPIGHHCSQPDLLR